jgi:gas vesicle protein
MRINIEGKDWSHMINTKDKVADAAASARPYVERALRDKELRENVRNAYTTARAVYDELSSRRKVSDAAAQLAADKDIQDEIRHAIGELRNAAGRVQDVRHGSPEAGRAARNGLLLLVGIAVGLLINPITGPALRRLLGRKLFGGGNGFVYQGNGSKS